jgi:hypothetical protein
VYLIYGASHQAGDEYVLHVGDIDVVTLSAVDEYEVEWAVFPNPVGDMMRFKVLNGNGEGAGVFIRIFNLMGRMVLELPLASIGIPLDVSALGPGAYTLELVSSEDRARLASKRFVKT